MTFTFGDISKAIIKANPEFIKECFIGNLGQFASETRISKGRFIVKLQFDAKEILKNPESIPFKLHQFKLEPYIIFLKTTREESKSIERGEKKE